MTESIKLSGVRETQQALYGYSNQLGDKVIFGALKKGANLVAKTIREGAPIYAGKPRKDVIPGTLRRGFTSYKSKIHNGKSNNKLGVYVTLKKVTKKNKLYHRILKDVTGKKRIRNPHDGFYARFLEHGWRPHGTGRKVGKKHAFFFKGFNRSAPSAVKLIEGNVIAGADIVKRKVGLR